MKVLLVGGTGFLGRHIARQLGASGFEVLATGRRYRVEQDHDPYPPGAFHRLDVTDGAAVEDLIGTLCPDAVIHLAGISNIPANAADPARATAINVTGTMHVLTAIARQRPEARVILVSSGSVYEGCDSTKCPWSEEIRPRPQTIYAGTKAAAEELGMAQARENGLDLLAVRPFNQIGPGQGPGFVIPDFCQQAIRISRGLDPPRLEVGNLEARRDFTDIRDTARAFHALLQHGHSGAVYNLSSGRPRSVAEVLSTLLERADVEVEIVRSPTLHRPLDLPVSAGDPSRASKELDWHPEIPLEKTLDDTLAEWHRRLDS